ncbi:MAG: hypothetical protein ABIG84_08230 [archaeon]
MPVNVLEKNTIDGKSETINECTKSWMDSTFGTATKTSCITVNYDTASLAGYSVSGFGKNYCAENKANFADTVAAVCLWGGTAAAVGVTFLSGGTLGTVVLPVVIGSGSVACEKLVNMGSKWPNDQWD